MKTTTRYATATPENWRDVRSLLEILPLRIDKAALFAELDQLAETPQGWPLDNRTLSKLCDGKLGRRSILGSDALQALFRGLLYAFVSSETGRVLSQEKMARPEDLRRQLRHFRPLIGVWSVQRYPMLSHLLLNPQLKLQYSSLISIPVLQFVRYVPVFAKPGRRPNG